jgi:Uma2 family endonuclease
MEAMSNPETWNPETVLRTGPFRPLKRVEFERLAKAGFFDDERVELLFGLVVPMTPIDQAHVRSAYLVKQVLERQLAGRATVYENSPLAASEISEPQPDVLVTDNAGWTDTTERAFLVVEVSRSSLHRDKGPKARIYGLADVAEYWIVDHVHGVVEVYRDREDGEWRTKTTRRRGDTIAMLAFPDVSIAVSEILPPAELIGEPTTPAKATE